MTTTPTTPATVACPSCGTPCHATRHEHVGYLDAGSVSTTYVPIDRRAIDRRGGVDESEYWSEGIAGGSNIVRLRDDNILGVARVDDTSERLSIIARHNASLQRIEAALGQAQGGGT